MRIKTFVLIVITVLVTVVLMQNNQSISFKVLLWQYNDVPLLGIIGVVAFFGLVIGFTIRGGRKKTITANTAITTAPNLSAPPATETPNQGKTLSAEDHEFLN